MYKGCKGGVLGVYRGVMDRRSFDEMSSSSLSLQTGWRSSLVMIEDWKVQGWRVEDWRVEGWRVQHFKKGASTSQMHVHVAQGLSSCSYSSSFFRYVADTDSTDSLTHRIISSRHMFSISAPFNSFIPPYEKASTTLDTAVFSFDMVSASSLHIRP